MSVGSASDEELVVRYLVCPLPQVGLCSTWLALARAARLPDLGNGHVADCPRRSVCEARGGCLGVLHAGVELDGCRQLAFLRGVLPRPPSRLLDQRLIYRASNRRCKRQRFAA
eukprot:7592239-Alexandrium_andersonii.AAC.1